MEGEDLQRDNVAHTAKLLDEIVPFGSDAIKTMKKMIDEKDFTSKSVGLMDVKCHNLQSRLVDISKGVLQICQSQSNRDDPSVKQLAGELRTVVDSIRPLEIKKKCPIDTIFKTPFPVSRDPVDGQTNAANREKDKDTAVDRGDAHGLKKNDDDDDGVFIKPEVPPVKNQNLVSNVAKKRALESSTEGELCEDTDDTPREEQIDALTQNNRLSINEQYQLDADQMAILLFGKQFTDQ